MRFAIKLLSILPWWAYLTIAGGIVYQGEQAYQSGVLHEQGVITNAVPGVVSFFVRGQETVLTTDVVANYLHWAIWAFAALIALFALFALVIRLLKIRITAAVVATIAVVLVVPFIPGVETLSFVPGVATLSEDLVPMAPTPPETVTETANTTAVLTSLRPTPRPNTLLMTNYPTPEVPQQIVASIGPFPLPQAEAINLPKNLDAPLAAATMTMAALPSVPPKNSAFVHISTSSAPKPDVSAAPTIQIVAPDIEESLVVAMPSTRNESANWPVIRSGSREAGSSMLATLPIAPLPDLELPPVPNPVMREADTAKPVVLSLASMTSPHSELDYTPFAGAVESGSDGIIVAVADIPVSLVAPTPMLHPETDFPVTSVPMEEEKDDIVTPAPPVSELILYPASEAEPKIVTRSEIAIENLVADTGGQPPKLETSPETPKARSVATISLAVLALGLFGVAIMLLWAMKRRIATRDDHHILSDVEEARWASLAQDASAMV